MANTQAVCDSFKVELLEGEHNFASAGGNTFKLALYTNSATLSNTTTAYSPTNEVGDSGTYSAGGGTLTNSGASGTGATAFIDFSDLSFTSATISAQAAVIYNANSTTNTNASVMVLDFGAVKTSTSGTFTIQFPTADASNAILRIS